MIKLIRPVLDHPFCYECFQSLIGAHYLRRVLVSEYIRPKPGDRILDIGCGPGNMLSFLPECRYLGVDTNQSYIASARQRYGHRGEFICERVRHYSVQQYGTFDIVLALALVHHLQDAEACDLFRIGHTALKSDGRMITHDGCYTPHQSAAKQYLLSRDRGQFVRTQEQYLALAHTSFKEVKVHLREDLLRIPYTLLIMESRARQDSRRHQL